MKVFKHNEIFGNWATLLLTTDKKGWIDYSKLFYVQLTNDISIASEEKEEFKSFIRSITTSSNHLAEQWDAPRTMVDMLLLVKGYYYDSRMKGSNSIKVVLPAVLQTSDFKRDIFSIRK